MKVQRISLSLIIPTLAYSNLHYPDKKPMKIYFPGANVKLFQVFISATFPVTRFNMKKKGGWLGTRRGVLCKLSVIFYAIVSSEYDFRFVYSRPIWYKIVYIYFLIYVDILTKFS